MYDLDIMWKFLREKILTLYKQLTCRHENAVTLRSDDKHVSYCPDCDKTFRSRNWRSDD